MSRQNLRGLQYLDGSHLPIDMADDRNALLLGGFEDGAKDVWAQRAIQFNDIIAGPFLLPHDGAALIGRLGGQKHLVQWRPPVDGMPGGVDRRTQKLSVSNLRPPFQVRRAAVHIQDSRHTIEQVGGQVVGREKMHMQVGQTRNQILTPAVDLNGTRWGSLVTGRNPIHFAVTDDDGAVFEDAFPVHRNDSDMRDNNRPRLRSREH